MSPPIRPSPQELHYHHPEREHNFLLVHVAYVRKARKYRYSFLTCIKSVTCPFHFHDPLIPNPPPAACFRLYTWLPRSRKSRPHRE